MSAVVDLESDAQELNDALKEDNNPFKDLDVDDINLAGVTSDVATLCYLLKWYHNNLPLKRSMNRKAY